MHAAMSAGALGGTVLAAFQDDTSVYSVGFNGEQAAAAMPRSTSKARAVSWNSSTKTMRSSDGSVSVDASAVLAFVATGALGAGVSVAGQDVTVALPDNKSYTFDLTDSLNLALFAELTAMDAVLARANGASAVRD